MGELVEVQERGDQADDDEEKDREGEGVEENCAPHGEHGVVGHRGRAMPMRRVGRKEKRAGDEHVDGRMGMRWRNSGFG